MDRSAIMRAVKSRDTSPEIVVRKLLSSFGYRYRLHSKKLPGKPDIVFPSRKRVILIHGCFWHGHDCKRGARIPKTNTDYWLSKIARNKERDKRHRLALAAQGWKIKTLWECKIKSISLGKSLKRFLGPPMLRPRDLNGKKRSVQPDIRLLKPK